MKILRTSVFCALAVAYFAAAHFLAKISFGGSTGILNKITEWQVYMPLILSGSYICYAGVSWSKNANTKLLDYIALLSVGNVLFAVGALGIESHLKTLSIAQTTQTICNAVFWVGHIFVAASAVIYLAQLGIRLARRVRIEPEA